MKRNNFIFLDSTQNYPLEFSAGNSKVEIISKGLLSNGRKVNVINPCFGCKKISKIVAGCKEGIVYKVFPKRNRLYSLVCLYITLKDLFKLRKDFKYVIYTQNHFLLYIFEAFYLKLLGYKIGVLYHELRYTTFQNPSFYTYYNAKLFDNFFGYFCDFILPISHYLKERCEKYGKPMLLTPILADFSQKKEKNNVEDYFLYCGSVDYLRITNAIVEGFNNFSKFCDDARLILVLSGCDSKKKIVQEKVNSMQLGKKVILKSNVPYANLLKLYSEARALLIPLDTNNLQDKARFSQKIAEYVSTKRPIVTNLVGEIPYYFSDISAYIAKDLSATALSGCMKKIWDSPQESDVVGENGYLIGCQYFDYKKYSFELLSFLKENYE